MSKFRFTAAQRYAIWLHHGQRCWRCREPLRLAETTVDHVIPESILNTPELLAKIVLENGLPSAFQVNGYENWLPAHSHCNREKSNRLLRMSSADMIVFETLIGKGHDVARTATAVHNNSRKDKLLAKIAHAIDAGSLSITDVSDFLTSFGFDSGTPEVDPTSEGRYLHLNNGYWVRRDSIADEGRCVCERAACVGEEDKVYCYFPSHLSAKVVRKRLFYRCYDEAIECPRCSEMHRRGYIGREGSCARPYTDQVNQVDTRQVN